MSEAPESSIYYIWDICYQSAPGIITRLSSQQQVSNVVPKRGERSVDFQAEREECCRRAGIPARSAFTSINSYPIEVAKVRMLSLLAAPAH